MFRRFASTGLRLSVVTARSLSKLKREPSKGLFVGGVKLPLAVAMRYVPRR